MLELRYKGQTFYSISDLITWAKRNGVRVITEKNRQVTIHNEPPNPSPPSEPPSPQTPDNEA